MPVIEKRRIVRLVLVIAILLIACSAFFLIPPKIVKADDPSNDYPSNLANADQDSLTDPWNFYNRECTSFVAWRLNNNNGIPFQNNNYKVAGTHFGSAQDWGAVAKSISITVDTTPATGAVAWWYFSATSGHVAWVTHVNSDGSVVVQDYNWGYPTNPGQFLQHTLTSAPTGYIHFPNNGSSSTPTATATTTILSLKSTRSPNGAIETFAATNSRVTENWYYNGGTGPQTRAIIDIAQNNIVGIDKLNIDSTELLYTAVSDGVWESTWAADSGAVTSSKPVTGLTGVRSVFAENTFDSSGYRIHHLYILASDGPYEAYWKDSDPNHVVTVSRLTQITGGIAMAHSIGPDGSEQLYVAVPTWVYEVSWFPGGTINVRTVINIAQGDIRSVEKGANLPDGGQPLYTTTSTTVWQTYWNGSSGFSNGTIATNQVNAFQSLKLVTPDGNHHVYLATPDHVQEYWWPPAFGGGELIRISQGNITAIAQQLDGTTQLLLTAAGNNVWETWWDSSHGPTTPSSPLFSVAK